MCERAKMGRGKAVPVASASGQWGGGGKVGKIGRVEGWKGGRMEGWKDGRMGEGMV